MPTFNPDSTLQILTRSRSAVDAAVRAKVHEMLLKADAGIRITRSAQIDSIGGYWQSGEEVRDRLLNVSVAFVIPIQGAGDQEVQLDFGIELRLDRPTASAQAILRTCTVHSDLDLPSSLFDAGSPIVDALKPRIMSIMNLPLHLLDLPKRSGLMSLEVMRDGSVKVVATA